MSATFRYRGQVESELGRPLVAAELETAASLAELSAAHAAVVSTLARQQLVACVAYLEAIVPSALRIEVMRFVSEID